MSGGKYALLIGASQFNEDGPAALTASESDIAGLRDALLDPQIGGFEPANVKNAINSGDSETESLIAWLCEKRNPEDLLILYYTGHGLCDQRTNKLYLALQGTKLSRPRINSLSADDIREEIALSRSRRKLVVLDCCHSGLFGVAGTKRGETRLVTTETFNPSGSGSWTLASSTADQVSLVDLKTHESVFTSTLVEALTEGLAAEDKEEIAVTDLANYLQDTVPARALELGGYMQPELLGSQTSPLIIARNPKPRKPVTDKIKAALIAPDILLREGAIGNLTRYARDATSLWHHEAQGLLKARLASDGERDFELRKLIEKALAAETVRLAGPSTKTSGVSLRAMLLACAATAGLAGIGGYLSAPESNPASLQEAGEFERQIDGLQEERTSVMASLSSASTNAEKLEKLYAEKASLEAALERAWAELASAKDSLAEMDEKRALEKSTLENELNTARKALADTQHTLSQARARQQPIVENNKALEARVKALTNENAELERELETKVAALQALAPPVTLAEPFGIAASSWTSGTPGASGASFREGLGLPEMVVIPSGSFVMGSPKSEKGREADEGPQRSVTVARFALSRTEITFGDWQACVAGGGCKSTPTPKDQGWGRGSRPVINVSWNDAQEYVGWLNEKVGAEVYRLPSESEWEYAARAGTTTPFWTGGTISTDQANYDGNFTYGSGRKGVYRAKTVPVGSLNAPNPFGLHDVHGNVWEWVDDCWRDNYTGAPPSSISWQFDASDGCSQRVLRGGSWFDNPRNLRSASRSGGGPGSRYGFFGFRLARTLTP